MSSPVLDTQRKQGTFFEKSKNFLALIDVGTRWVLVGCMAMMTIIVCTQVFFRYVLSSSIDSADELSRLMFVWCMFLAIPHGVRVGSHVGIDILISFLDRRVREIVMRSMLSLCAFLSLVVFYFSLEVVMENWETLMPTISITSSIFYIPVLISMAHSFLHLGLLCWGGTDIWKVKEVVS